MDFATKHETEALKGDISATTDNLSKANEKYAQELKNGLLDEIRREIENPTKPKIKIGLKNKLRQIKNALSIMFFG